MNGFLVVYVADMDDIPLRLFGTNAEAEKYAEEVGDFYANDDEAHHPDMMDSLNTLGRDVGTYQGIEVFTFVGGRLERRNRVADQGDDTLPAEQPREGGAS